MSRLLFLVPIVALASVPVYILFLKSPPPMPEINMNEWWGPANMKQEQDTSIRPFKIKFDDAAIADLKLRLKNPRPFTPPLEGVGFEYGFNSLQMDSWLKYWATEYNFKEREKFLNQFPQFKTNIQGLDIHFIRVTPQVSKGVEIVPLLLLHGWPGSVREFYELIPMLTAVSNERNFAIEVIAPSLPGFGFSDPAIRPGLESPQMAVIFKNLMQRLGFKQFYVQGGDWGAFIGNMIATLFPEDILGYHTNMPITKTTAGIFLEIVGSLYPSLVKGKYGADKLYPLSTRYSLLLEESGYFHIQATKPDTVGIGLSDSPAGLLAYILEKFIWTRPIHRTKVDGGLEFRFTKDQLIDNLMMYWIPNSMTSAMRLYAETFNSKSMSMTLDEIPTPVPTWALQAKYEILAYQPPCILKYKFTNLVDMTVVDDGGHFFALELPEILAKDVLKAVGEFRKLKKVGKTEL